MKIGLGLPAAIAKVPPDVVLEWARRADNGPFSSIAVVDRLVYGNLEPLTTLAAAASVTSRVRLTTAILLAALRPAGVLAKEAATIDALSGGRLTLGIAAGRRPDDFDVAPAVHRTRGRRFTEQIGTMRKIWAGEQVGPEAPGVVGPAPSQSGGPELLLGGASDPAIERAAALGAGYIAGGGAGPAGSARLFKAVTEAWERNNRKGKPRFVGCSYFFLEEDQRSRATDYIVDYYGFLGEGKAEGLAASMPSSIESVKETVAAYQETGADELILLPCTWEVEQVDRLAAALG